jgi:hypothetical protein
MTTDPIITREDLEMAAKAAGLVVVGEADKMVAQPGRRHEGGLVVKNEFGGDSLWHPGEDDGDCARMEDAVGIDVCRFRRLVRVCVSGQGIVDADFADHDNDRSRARRYASVKLAAAVGRAM